MATHAEMIAVPEAIAHDIASHVNDQEIADALATSRFGGARESARRIENSGS